MNGLRRWGTAAAATLAFVGITAGPAFAAPPSNDTVENATPVTVGFSETLDTTEATTDADDAQLNQVCGAPATDASVWYQYDATSDATVIVDVSASNYSAGVLVGVGEPGALEIVACGPLTVLFSATAGETYYVLAIDDQSDGGGNGGQLQISFLDAGPTPSVALSVNPNGRVDSRGNALVHGSYTCENGESLELFGDVLQLRLVAVRAFFDTVITGQCDGTRHTWRAVADPVRGRFTTDKALVTTFGFVCGQFLCADGYAERVVRLRAARG